jgi:hypothetical protein
MKKKILIIACLFLCLFSYTHFIKRTKGFCIAKILSKHTFNPRWDFGAPSPEQEKLLDQIASEPFTLVGSGKECYAFVNESETLVVKFFKQKHMRTQLILNHLPLGEYQKKLHQETLARRTNHRNRLFSSYQIAYERLKAQTGVLYLHLNKTNNLKRTICLIEPSGKKHRLQLDNLEFLVQKRAYSILDTLTSLMKQNKIDAAKDIIVSILDLITTRKKLGIGDDDINCERNLGLFDGKAFQVDVGEFFSTLPSSPIQEDYTSATEDLRLFLTSHYPELASYLKKEIDKKCNKPSG